LAAICGGEAGAGLAPEGSRVGGEKRGWPHLLGFWALTKNGIIQHHGVYRPQQNKDRFVLGLQGGIRGFEVSLFRQRARQAFEQKVQRGHTLWEVPVGFVRTEDDRCEQIPDRQVQQAVTGVFRKFHELGSARQTTLWYRDQNIPLPQVQPGSSGRDITWAPATLS